MCNYLKRYELCKLILLLFFLSSFLILLAKSEENNLGLPNWFYELPDSSDNIMGIGASDIDLGYEVAKEQAIERARTMISFSLNTKIRGISKEWEGEKTKKEKYLIMETDLIDKSSMNVIYISVLKNDIVVVLAEYIEAEDSNIKKTPIIMHYSVVEEISDQYEVVIKDDLSITEIDSGYSLYNGSTTFKLLHNITQKPEWNIDDYVTSKKYLHTFTNYEYIDESIYALSDCLLKTLAKAEFECINYFNSINYDREEMPDNKVKMISIGKLSNFRMARSTFVKEDTNNSSTMKLYSQFVTNQDKSIEDNDIDSEYDQKSIMKAFKDMELDLESNK